MAYQPHRSAARDDGLLSFEQRIRKAQIDLAGAIPPNLSAEGARHDQIGLWERVETGGNSALALLAGNDVVCRFGLSLLAVVHRHRRNLDENVRGRK